ncbi:MAG TPA: M14 family zinc carboxypeptidase, partial [Chryseolinea sp.]|nr:M14 family zinc carboxypeptidase [Chryseolinea sp.]
MRQILLLFILVTSFAKLAIGQPDISYYLPEGITFHPSVPTPKSVIGHEVGEWHVTHDRLVNYMYALDKASDRVSLEVTGQTYEGRPMLLLTITSPKNHERLEEIRQQHLALSDPARAGSVDTKAMPVVFYIGFSI